jgi:NADH dehydrogenase (ubiquinone) 1 alpha subcomplex subunit 5
MLTASLALHPTTSITASSVSSSPNMRSALRLLKAASESTAPLQPYKAGQRSGKLTTGIHGLPVHHNPLPDLLNIYRQTLSSLQSKVPAGVVYRQAAETLTQHRVEVIERHAGQQGKEGGEKAIEAIERELDAGLIEEVMKVAEGELKLVDVLAESKA